MFRRRYLLKCLREQQRIRMAIQCGGYWLHYILARPDFEGRMRIRRINAYEEVAAEMDRGGK